MQRLIGTGKHSPAPRSKADGLCPHTSQTGETLLRFYMGYADYVRHQSSVNREKFALTSLTAGEARAIADYYRVNRPSALVRTNFFGLCLGIRNGAEIRALSRYLGRRVIGVDISDSIIQVPNGFWCDFSHCPDLWKGKVDFLYSNSYDHAVELDATLASWVSLLSSEGLMFLQFTPTHAKEIRMDLDNLIQKLVQHGLEILAVHSLETSRGFKRRTELFRNIVRQIGKRMIAPAVPNAWPIYWNLKYNLRHGILLPTQILVAAPGRRTD
jgi:hypothetical protein